MLRVLIVWLGYVCCCIYSLVLDTFFQRQKSYVVDREKRSTNAYIITLIDLLQTLYHSHSPLNFHHINFQRFFSKIWAWKEKYSQNLLILFMDFVLVPKITSKIHKVDRKCSCSTVQAIKWFPAPSIIHTTYVYIDFTRN